MSSDSEVEVVDLSDDELMDQLDDIIGSTETGPEPEQEPPLRRPFRSGAYNPRDPRQRPRSSYVQTKFMGSYVSCHKRDRHIFDDLPEVETQNPLENIKFCIGTIADFLHNVEPSLIPNLNLVARRIYALGANRPCADPFCNFGRARKTQLPTTEGKIREIDTRDAVTETEADRSGKRDLADAATNTTPCPVLATPSKCTIATNTGDASPRVCSETQTDEQDWLMSVLAAACVPNPHAQGIECSPSQPTLWSSGERSTTMQLAQNLAAGMPVAEAVFRAEFAKPPPPPEPPVYRHSFAPESSTDRTASRKRRSPAKTTSDTIGKRPAPDPGTADHPVSEAGRRPPKQGTATGEPRWLGSDPTDKEQPTPGTGDSRVNPDAGHRGSLLRETASNSGVSRPKRPRSPNGPRCADHREAEGSLRRTQQPSRRAEARQRSSVFCFNCRQYSHRWQECNEPVTSDFCVECGNRGVRTEHCGRCRNRRRREKQKKRKREATSRPDRH